MNMANLTADALLILAYLLGSIPFGLLLTRLAGLGDIRQIGSGNIGATNVLRTGNKKLAALTLLLDGLKGAAAVLIAAHFAPATAPFAGLAALAGHLFPIWLKFRGGKGVATGIGVLLALMWPVGLAVMVVWLATAYLARRSSLAALVAFGLSPAFALFTGYGDRLWLTVTVMAIIFITHRANIRRLKAGTEPKISARRTPPVAKPLDGDRL